MIAIIDYGVGNLFSLGSSLAALGIDSVVTDDENVIRNADKIILPGVGAFGDAAEALRCRGLDEVLCREAAGGKPLLGICLGMQMMFEYSDENVDAIKAYFRIGNTFHCECVPFGEYLVHDKNFAYFFYFAVKNV